jgi:hypothetical protein
MVCHMSASYSVFGRLAYSATKTSWRTTRVFGCTNPRSINSRGEGGTLCVGPVWERERQQDVHIRFGLSASSREDSS